VADEFLLDLMASASGITYEEAARSVVVHEIDGIRIPFANPELLYRMKKRAGRERPWRCLLSRTTLRRPWSPIARGLRVSHSH